MTLWCGWLVVDEDARLDAKTSVGSGRARRPVERLLERDLAAERLLDLCGRSREAPRSSNGAAVGVLEPSMSSAMPSAVVKMCASTMLAPDKRERPGDLHEQAG